MPQGKIIAREVPLELFLEDFVPYDESIAWRIHDAYYAERGIAAWTGGDIPFAGTNNSGIARQHARLFVELVRELDATGALAPDDLVHVLEVGSGACTFAVNFVDALAHDCGAAGRALAGRLRYVISDYSPRNLEEATASTKLASLVASGTVVPATFDLRRPGELAIPSPRGGRRGARVSLAAVVANYVCCVSPLKVIRRTADGLFEKHLRLKIDVADAAEGKAVTRALTRATSALPPAELLQRIEAVHAWRPLDLEKAFAAANDRALVTEFLDSLGEATINYPYAFLDLLRGLRPRLLPGGMFLVSDFGSPDRSDVQSPTNDRAPVKYGLSLTHDVDFALLDAFAAREGLAIVRTDDGLLEVHTAAIRNMRRVPASFAAKFERTHVRSAQGQELLDLSAAAAVLYDAGRFHESARLYGLCLRIAPRSPQVIYRFGRAALAANVQGPRMLRRLARRLRVGRRLDARRTHDWDTLLARVSLALGEAGKARQLLVRSLGESETASKHETLALAYELLGDRKRAYASRLRALELEPVGEPAALARERLFREYLSGEDAPVRWRPRRDKARQPRT